ncbi:MAG TPA: hypothetical protein VIE65_19420 [Methylobacter sp.]|jgi:hypothetical protein
MIQPAYTVTVAFDETSRCYVVMESDLEGLKCEASSAVDIVALINDRAKAILHVPTVEIRARLPAARPRLIAG